MMRRTNDQSAQPEFTDDCLQKKGKLNFKTGLSILNIFGVFVFIILSVSTAMAGETIICDLSNCIDYALRNNPDIQYSEALVSLDEAKLLRTKEDFAVPDLIIKARLGYLDGEPTTPFSLVRGVTEEGEPVREGSGDYYNFGAQLRIPIFKEGSFVLAKPSSVLRDENAVKVQKFNRDANRDNVIYQVTDAYLSALKTLEDVSQREQQVAYQKLQYDLAESKFRDEIISQREFLETSESLALAKAELIKARNAYTVALAELAFAMGADPSVKIELRENAQGQLPSLQLDNLIATAYQQRDEIRAQIERIQKEKASVQFASRQGFPSLHVIADYGIGDDFDSPDNSYFSVALQLRFNIMDAASKKGGVALAQARVIMEEAALQRMKQTVALEITKIFHNIKTLESQIASMAEHREKYLDEVRLAEERYAKQLVSEASLMEAKLALSEKVIAMKKAEYDLEIEVALLERAIGSKLDEVTEVTGNSRLNGMTANAVTLHVRKPGIYPAARIDLKSVFTAEKLPIAQVLDESSDSLDLLLGEISRPMMTLHGAPGAGYRHSDPFENSRNYHGRHNEGILVSGLGQIKTAGDNSL